MPRPVWPEHPPIKKEHKSTKRPVRLHRTLCLLFDFRSRSFLYSNVNIASYHSPVWSLPSRSVYSSR